jgi:histidine triad (HIT) family protein
MTAGCIFCSVVRGEAKAAVVLDDERLLGFLDHRPLFEGHVLLVPRRHHETLEDLPESDVAPLFAATRRLCTAVRTALGAEGTFVAMNNTVSQSVPHLHVHVVPRTKGDGLRGFFWPRTKYASPEDMEAVAARIRARLG